jgi:hypothetical protein
MTDVDDPTSVIRGPEATFEIMTQFNVILEHT